MKFTELKNESNIDLPLAGIERGNGAKNYFTFNFDDRTNVRVPMFKYQENKDIQLGTNISLYVKTNDKGELQLVQDFAQVFQELYKEGTTYDFVVMRDMTQMQQPYYLVSDNNGFQLKLPASGIDHLYVKQNIRCKVVKLHKCYVGLKLVKDNEDYEQLEMLDLDSLLSCVSTTDDERAEATEMKRIFQSELANTYCSQSAEEYKKGHSEWLFLAMSAIDEHLPEIVKDKEPETVDTFLRFLREITLYLLEGSNYISNLNDNERSRYQELLSTIAHHVDNFKAAYTHIAKGEDITFIDRLLNNIRNSGYLYEPNRVFNILMYLFRLKPELLSEKMQSIFEVIISKPLDTWQAEPFRSAFVNQLQFYITTTKPEVDKLASIDDTADRQKLEKIVTALSIQQLLAKDGDNVDIELNAAMLYRYLTFYNTSGSDVLFDNAYDALLSNVHKMAFGLSDCKQPLLLAKKLDKEVYRNFGNADATPMTYTGDTLQLEMAPSQLTISSISTPTTKNALSSKQQALWKNIQVRCGESISQHDASLEEYARQWRQVELDITKKMTTAQMKRKRRQLFINDIVEVYIYAQVSESSSTYKCKFVDPDIDYDAVVNVKNMVRFATSSKLSYFIDPVTGRPFKYSMKVKNITDQNRERPIVDLSFIEAIDEYCDFNLHIGEQEDCLVMNEGKDTYLCLTNWGASILLDKEDCPPNLLTGDTVVVTMADAKHATYESYSSEIITAEGSFKTLMQEIHDGPIPPEEETTEETNVLQADTLLTADRVEELIRIIDRMTVLTEDYKLTFHYLHVERLLAIMIDDKKLVEYIDKRLKLLLLLDNFAVNHTVNIDELEKVGNLSSKVTNQSATMLKIISSLDDQMANQRLWDICENDTDTRTCKLSRLALAYNLMADTGLAAQRQTIRRTIDEILHFNTSEGVRSYGEESETVEFKTSMVYPPENHMMPNIKVQTGNILRVICSFLNTKGGELYIGVNDQGCPTGLVNDLSYKQFYGQHDPHDAYDVYLRNSVRMTMHDIANSRISTRWERENGKDIYIVTIEASPEPVYFNDTIYVRRGSTSVALHDDDVEHFLKSRTTSEPTEQKASTTKDTHTATAAPEPPTSLCLTGKQRNNILHEYLDEDNFVQPIKYLTLFADGKYEVTENEWPEPEGQHTQIAIHEEEENGWFVMVYANGSAVRVPMKQLLEKNGKYNRCTDLTLYFASPAKEDDCLLLFLKDGKNNSYYRIDPVSHIEEGSMRSIGKPLTNVPGTAFYCDVVPRGKTAQFTKAYNLPPTNIGYAIKTKEPDTVKITSITQKAGLNF